MTPERWKRVEDLYESASGLPPTERDQFLRVACADDDEVRAEVESLLSVNAESTRFLETPVMELSAALPAAIAAGSVLPDPLVGELVGSYRVIRRLGTGGMGVVYLAEQRNPSRTVALKLIRPGIASASMLKRFEHEARALGRLHHIGIAQIYEAGTAQTAQGLQPYFAMEYIVGEPLLRYVTDRALGVRDRLAILIRICDAVQHAHSKGVVHRDIKPGNILVEAGAPDHQTPPLESTSPPFLASLTSSVGQPKILDFGVARMTDTDPHNATMRTEVGQLVGTLAYMSPEQVAPPSTPAGMDAIDTRSDVYSLGVLAFEVLTGQLPYHISGKPIHEAARAICEAAPSRPGVLDRALRGDVETVLLKALEKDPSRRYQSAAALGDDLRRVLLNQPIQARPASTAYQLRKLVARHKLSTAALAGAFLLIVGFGIWMSVLYTQADHLRTEAQTAYAAESKAHTKAQESERLATRRAETASRMLEVLVDAFRAIDPSMSASANVNARDVVAREIVERGIRKIEREMRDEPIIRAHLLASLGNTMGGLGYYDRATALLQQAVDSRRNDSIPPPQVVGDYLESMSRFLGYMGKDDEARNALSEALTIYRHYLAPDAPEIASALSAMAFLEVLSGNVEEAERLCMEAMRMHNKTPGHEDILGAEALNSLGGALCERGEYARAAEVIQRGLDRVLRRDRDPMRMESSFHANLAWVQCMSGQYELAESEARTALEMRLKQFSAGHSRTTPPMLTLGIILTLTDRPEEGEKYIRDCIEIRKRTTPSNFGSIGEAESALGECLARQNKFDEAESLLLTSFRALQSEANPSMESCQLALQRIARYYEKLGDSDKAEEYIWLLRSPWDAPWVRTDAAPADGSR
jgi:eukaryotic-like serine/threonine-protein kinase